jgi:hypothetical protein
MSIEAMKQALEALELMYACYAHSEWISHKQQEKKILAQCVATTMTLRQAIAKAEKQEPVGWIDTKGNMVCTKINESCKPLYTTPQQRTWVGLTYEDMVSLQKDLHDSKGEIVLPTTFAKAVEAKLKEKNNG